MFSIDKTAFGVAAGIILPFITALLFYKYGYQGELPISTFLKQMMYLRGLPMLLAVCCLPNLALFSIFININKLNISRGLFLATLLFAVAIVIFKFVV